MREQRVVKQRWWRETEQPSAPSSVSVTRSSGVPTTQLRWNSNSDHRGSALSLWIKLTEKEKVNWTGFVKLWTEPVLICGWIKHLAATTGSVISERTNGMTFYWLRFFWSERQKTYCKPTSGSERQKHKTQKTRPVKASERVCINKQESIQLKYKKRKKKQGKSGRCDEDCIIHERALHKHKINGRRRTTRDSL